MQIVLAATHHKFYGLEKDYIDEIIINIVGSASNGVSNPLIHRVIESLFDLYLYSLNKSLYLNIQQKIAKSQSKFTVQREYLDEMDFMRKNIKKLSNLASTIFSILGLRCEGERCLDEPGIYVTDKKSDEEIIKDAIWKVVHEAEINFLMMSILKISDKYKTPCVEYIQEMKPYINELYLNIDNRNIVTTFLYLIKTVEFKYTITTLQNHEVAYKSFSLELLNILLTTTKHSLIRDMGMIAIIKKMFIPSLLKFGEGNCLLNNDYFKNFIDLTYLMWKYYRDCFPLEIAIFIHHIYIKILKSHNSTIFQKIYIMKTIFKLFDSPYSIIEIYLNYDNNNENDNWNILHELVSIICSLIENKAVDRDENPLSPATDDDTNSNDASAARQSSVSAPVIINKSEELQRCSLEVLTVIVKYLMEGCCTFESMVNNKDLRSRFVRSWSIGNETEALLNKTAADTGNNGGESMKDSIMKATTMLFKPDQMKKLDLKTPQSTLSAHSSAFNVISDRLKRNEIDDKIKKALDIAVEKESLKKGIKYLIDNGCLKDDPEVICTFLRSQNDKIDENLVGDYLGEGGVTDEEVAFYNKLRMHYIQGINCKGLDFVEALRRLLTKSGFRLPGESQKIERFVEVFSQIYYKENPGVFSSCDVAMVLSYSLIMLNTDAHNDQIKPERKMKLEEFVSNNRGIDDGKDLPKVYIIIFMFIYFYYFIILFFNRNFWKVYTTI